MRHSSKGRCGRISSKKSKQQILAAIESLEIRRLLATITVNSTADTITPGDGAVTLREAITAINAGNALGDPNILAQPLGTFGTNDAIHFNISGTGVHTIQPASQLPTITKAVKIDGYTQSGASAATHSNAGTTQATIEIEIDGENAGAAAIGLVVEAPNVTIDGLAINRFKSEGIELDGSNNDVVSGNYLGTDPTGATGEGNGGSGILIQSGADNDTVGGTTAAERNVISGNSFYGVDIVQGSGSNGEGTADNVVEGNYIGTDATGTEAIGNTADGVLLELTLDCTIGGTAAGAGNLISGNGDNGVYLNGGLGATIEGNFIGTDVTGTKALQNTGDGVHDADFGVDDVIGGEVAGARNIISGNHANGIEATLADGMGIQGNYIGTDVTGTKAIANRFDGVVFDGKGGVSSIGGRDAGAGNLISGNGANGIDIIQGVTSIFIDGNDIGTDATGLLPLGNSGNGIQIQQGANFIQVGGFDFNDADRNVISGNANNGVEIDGSSPADNNTYGNTANNFVGSNYIGVDATGSAALGNKLAGVLIDHGSQNNTVGSTDADARNVISANGDNVQIDGTPSGTNTTGNTVEGNFLGTDATGINALIRDEAGNGIGVLIEKGAQNNIVGGTTAAARNVISGYAVGGVGVEIDGATSGTQTSGNTVEGNYIGTDITGASAITYADTDFEGERPLSGGDGIYISNFARNNTIGGTSAGARNIISGNFNNGIEIESAFVNTIEGNYIGVDVTGSKALGNSVAGIFIGSGTFNLIGGTTAAARNIISGNGTAFFSAGIEIDGGSNETVQGNYIGTDATGSVAIGNSGDGVLIGAAGSDNVIGGAIAAAQNVIAFNGGAGVVVRNESDSGGGAGGPSAAGDTVRLNSIYANTGLGIDLNDDGVTPNDPHDVDGGANDTQNFPVIVTASSNATSVTVTGTFNSLANTNFTLDFYASDTVDPSGDGQGKQYIGSIGLITDSNGNATFSSTFNVTIGANNYISSTATNESTAPFGETSEFSQSVDSSATIVTPPPPPPTPPTLSINDVTLNEGNSGTTDFTFTVTRAGDTTGTSDVSYSTIAGGTATAGTDYTAIASTPLHFAANQTTAQFTVKVNGDTTVESDETFFVSLTNPTNATIADGQGTGTITNDDTAPPPPPVAKVSIITDPCDSTKTAVEIDGTNNNDTISVTKSGTAQGKVVVKINNVIKGTFSFTGSIVVHGLIGNDNISIDSAITRQTFLFGELGNDTISGGGGSDVIVGGDGNDKLSGNAGRDLLFGGNGTDSLNGGADDDLLDSGTTHFDTDIASLCKLQDEWVRTDKTYAQRVSDITNGGGLNGSVELNKNTTFNSTTSKDTLTGSGGSDLFFAASTGDVLTDKASGETVVKIG